MAFFLGVRGRNDNVCGPSGGLDSSDEDRPGKLRFGERHQRVVIIEFDSVEKAAAAHDSEGYQAALRVLGKAADRDLRIVEGIE